MNRTTRWITIAALGVAVLGCASEPKPQSQAWPPLKVPGFLGDYSMLKPEKDANGEEVMRYVNPKLAPGGPYRQLLIDAAQFYPAAQPSEYVDAKTFNDVRNYVDVQMRNKLGAKVPLASQPGPGVVRVRTAITSVDTQSAEFKVYEVLPVSMVYSLIRGRGKEGLLGIEVEMLDSQTGERLGAAVRHGTSDRFRGRDEKLTLEQLKPVLDEWTAAGAQFVAEKFPK
jgi:hypothetical protein